MLSSSSRSLGDALERPLVLVIGLVFVLILGALNAAPFLHDPIWQDEAVTLFFHASRGLVDPFLEYISPNNHMAFSAMLAGWMKLFPNGVDVLTLRLLPALMFLSAIPLLWLIALRLGGPACAVTAGLIFATSSVAGSFATQLRGYAPSWFFFSLMLLAALSLMAGRRQVAWRAAYFAGCLFSISLLPTNFFFSLVVAVAVAVYHALSPENRRRSRLGVFAFLLASPVACLLLSYGVVWDELMRFSGMGFSQWTDAEVVRNWLRGSLSNVIWVTPLVGAGLFAGLQGIATDRGGSPGARPGSREFVLATLLIIGFLVATLLIPSTPFPRTLVPFLPVWVCAISYLMIYGIRRAVQGRELAGFGFGLALFSLILLSANSLREPCEPSRSRAGAFDYDLCYQYFRDGYRPEKVLDAWATLERADVPIVANFEGFYAIRALGSSAPVFRFDVYEPAERLAPLLVAHDSAEMAKMGEVLGLDPAAYRLLADTGYFKVYLPTAGN